MIFDAQGSLLLYENTQGKWEIPGGGWEYGETLEECVRRELEEEMALEVAKLGEVKFVYTYISRKGYQKLCLAVPVELAAGSEPRPSEAVLQRAWYASKEEVLNHGYQAGEIGTKLCVHNLQERVWR